MRNYPTIQDIREARERLKPHVRHTPLLRADKIEKKINEKKNEKKKRKYKKKRK